MEETGEAYASGGGGSTQLGISLEQNRLGSETPGLYCRYMPSGSAPYDKDVNVEHGLAFVHRGRILGTRLADKTGGSQDRSARDL